MISYRENEFLKDLNKIIKQLFLLSFSIDQVEENKGCDEKVRSRRKGREFDKKRYRCICGTKKKTRLTEINR